VEFHAEIHEEGGGYWAEVRELPGCFASGRSLDELKDALLEAIEMCLEPGQPQGANGSRAPRVGGITLVYA